MMALKACSFHIPVEEIMKPMTFSAIFSDLEEWSQEEDKKENLHSSGHQHSGLLHKMYVLRLIIMKTNCLLTDLRY